MSKLKGVLLMAYGTPRNLDEVEPYYRDILGGRTPRPEAVEELTERYRMVGGKTPLSAGLLLTYEAVMREKNLNPDVMPMMILLTDGAGNVSISDSPRRLTRS